MTRSHPKGGKGSSRQSKKIVTGGGDGVHATSDTGASGAMSNATEGLLSPELIAELGGDANAGGAVAVSVKKGKKRGRGGGDSGGGKVSSETRELAATISKSKAKKLKQLEDKRLKDGRRAELYQKLEQNRMSQGQLSLLQSSKTISQNQDTLRSRIKQAVQRAVAGIPLSDPAIAELESHPDLVADAEEALSLPVGGGALAATRNTATAGGYCSRAPTAGKKGQPKGGEHKGVEKMGSPGARGINGTGKMAASGAGRIAGVSAAAIGKKRGRSMGSDTPKPVQVAVAGRPRSSSSSSTGSSTSNSDGSSSEDDQQSEAKTNAISKTEDDPSEATTKRTSAIKNSDKNDGAEHMEIDGSFSLSTGADGAFAEESDKHCAKEASTPPSNMTTSGSAASASISDDTAQTSGESWAEKMMSSLAHLPTSKSTTTFGLKAVASGVGKEPSTTMDTEGAGQVSTAGSEEAVRESSGDSAPESNTKEDAALSLTETAAVSYPPPPRWLEENAPAYHAVETPLPSVSGDSAGSGGASRKGSGSRLPRPERWVPVERPVELQSARMQLPVCGMEQEIMEAIHDNDTIILCGETGSGKSTQVPQFLYEAGYAAHGLIGVTQPRRVAAVGTAERVAVELGTKCGRGGAVAYQIRYDASGVGESTRVKFMTDGVLLQEISSDLLLRKYSVVLLDEAHERNLNTDMLLGMLSRSIPLRKKIAEEEQRSWEMLSDDRKKDAKLPLRPLKLVIMSATLRVTDFTENSVLFPTPPPVISATSRQHPVTVHFSKNTELYDYVGETFKKVCKVHQRLPGGGVLVFLTGKREILHMCDKLRREFPIPRARKKSGRENRGESAEQKDSDIKDGSERRNSTSKDETVDEADEQKAKAGEAQTPKLKETTSAAITPVEKPRETDRETLLYREADDDEEDAARLADMEGDQNDEIATAAVTGGHDGKSDRDSGSSGEGGLSSDSEAEDEDGGQKKVGDFGDGDGGGPADTARSTLPPVHVVPLYAMLTAEEQAKVFRPPPEGHRLIVVATNVAETSITIPGIAYVVDCGRQKRRVVQRGSGISQFEVGWVSKASADQRAGRAGRTGPGHCYRLYSSAVYTQTLEDFAPPEVLTRPLEDVMLQMKAMGIIDVSCFPFPTPPDAAGLRAAATLLANLGATAGRGYLGDVGGREGDGTGEITAVGKALALLPVGARYAKMLLLAVQGGLLSHAAALVAILTEGDPFLKRESAVKKDGGGEVPDGRGGAEEEDKGTGGEVDEEEIRRKRAQWLHPNSDALARLKAAGAYAHVTSGGTATGGGDFCRDNFLHGPTMERSLQLRRQLSRLVSLRFGTDPRWKCCDVTKTLRPPSRRQSDALRQVLLSGLLDSVARKAPAGTVKAGSKLQRDCAYLSCNEAITEPLYIKSSSALFSRDPQELPEWVVYQDIVRGEREGAPANMTCVTAIESTWLPALAEGSPLLSFSSPLVSPPPTYDTTTHTIMCRVTPRYGVHAWELPPYATKLATAAPANKPDSVFRWFGRLLLEGGVAGCLSELKAQEMLNDPSSLLTREMPTKKVAILVLDLRKRGVSSLPTLVEQWRQDPTYLKSSVGLWVKVGCKPRFEKAWANTVKTAVAASKGAGAQVRRGAGGVISTSGGPTGEREEGPRKRSRA